MFRLMRSVQPRLRAVASSIVSVTGLRGQLMRLLTATCLLHRQQSTLATVRQWVRWIVTETWSGGRSVTTVTASRVAVRHSSRMSRGTNMRNRATAEPAAPTAPSVSNGYISFAVDKSSDIFCLQCFDAVGWAAGRASGL